MKQTRSGNIASLSTPNLAINRLLPSSGKIVEVILELSCSIAREEGMRILRRVEVRDPKETVKFRSWVNGCNAYRTIRSNDGTYIVAFPEKAVALTKAVRYREEIEFQLRAKQTMVKDHSFWNAVFILDIKMNSANTQEGELGTVSNGDVGVPRSKFDEPFSVIEKRKRRSGINDDPV